MATRERRVDRGAQRGRRVLAVIGQELREARLSAGLSQAAVGSLLGTAHNKVGRVEAGTLAAASVLDFARHAAVLGLDLSVKLYPDGPPIRDAAHAALLERLKAKLGDGLQMRTEVPLPIEGDRRAWDAVIYGAGEPIGVEAETRLRDVQALTRRVALKQRDAGFACVLLVVKSSRANRQTVREMASVLASSFPTPSRLVLAALATGRRPPGSALLVL